MTTICLSQELISKLDNLDKPLQFCDESGHLIGSFIPEMASGESMLIAGVESDLRAGEEQLGAELCVFGFETDLE